VLSRKLRLRDILAILEVLSYLLALYGLSLAGFVLFAIPRGWIPNLGTIGIVAFMGSLLLALTSVFLVAAICAGLRQSRSRIEQAGHSSADNLNPQALNEIVGLLKTIEANTRRSPKEGSAPAATAESVEAPVPQEAEAQAPPSGSPEVQKQLEELLSAVRQHIDARRWAEAEGALEKLKTDFSDSPEVPRLAEFLHARMQGALEEQARKLYGEMESAIRAERWQEALEAARALLALYPKTPEAQKLSERLPELERKANLQRRPTLFAQVKKDIANHRYLEAYEEALNLLAEFPESREADIVRRDLSELRKRAQAEP